MIRIHEETLREIYQHAIDEYPYECCGIVTGNIHNQTVHRCRNIQNELHAQDPERYPRDARTAYIIDRKELERIHNEAKEKGWNIIAFYHSHIDCGAFFSETDISAQTVFGEPEFPDALHIVVSVINKKINETGCFKWDRTTGNFVAVEC